MISEAELEALGVYDPTTEHAALRLELLRYMEGLGATPEELVAWGDRLPALAFVLGIRGGPALTLAEAAAAAGLSEDEVRRLARAAGFADPDPDAAVFTHRFAELAAMLPSVAEYFGEEANLQLIRVLGAAMARVADTVVSLFLVNVEPSARREDPVGLAVARANTEAAGLVPLLAPTLDILFRQHVIAAQRSTGLDADVGTYEAQPLVVGFVDLVGSTELGERLSLGELGSLLTRFEHVAIDTITARGGRVIKLIGDEVLFTVPDAAAACGIALELATGVDADEALDAVRAGLASGPVMLRDGDVFGPVVNLAARIVAVAAPGEVLVTQGMADATGLPSEPRGRHALKGIAGEVDLVRLLG